MPQVKGLSKQCTLHPNLKNETTIFSAFEHDECYLLEFINKKVINSYILLSISMNI